jgi:hypothetical protein
MELRGGKLQAYIVERGPPVEILPGNRQKPGIDLTESAKSQRCPERGEEFSIIGDIPNLDRVKNLQELWRALPLHSAGMRQD